MGWGGWQGRTGWAALAWLSSLPAAQSQYLKTSKDELVVEKYYEVQKAGTKDLENLIGEHVGCPSALPTYLRTTTAACYPYLNEKYNPQDGVLLEAEFKPFADIDQYRCAGGALLHTARAQHPAAPAAPAVPAAPTAPHATPTIAHHPPCPVSKSRVPRTTRLAFCSTHASSSATTAV